MEYFYEGEHLTDPLGLGKNYEVEDITMMMGDLEEFSSSHGKELDSRRVLSDEIKGFEEKDEIIYNVMVAECLRGVVFNDVGDIINICLRYSDNGAKVHSSYANIGQFHNQCFSKVKARVVATSRKFPGFFKFSGYK